LIQDIISHGAALYMKRDLNVVETKLAIRESLAERPDGFLNQADQKYLRNYAIEHFTELLTREKLNRFDMLFDQGEEFEIKFGTRQHRAIIID